MKAIQTSIPELQTKLTSKRAENNLLRKERDTKREIAAIKEKRSNIKVNYTAPSLNWGNDLKLISLDPFIER